MTGPVRVKWRKPGVELSADTRAWAARIIAAHDDPAVSESEFLALCRPWADHVATLSEAEQLEAGLALFDHANRHITGRPGLTAVALFVPERTS